MSLKKTTLLFLICAFFSCTQLLAQSTRFAWARQMGGANDDRIESVKADAAGNIYTVGYFKDTADFDPGPGVFNLISAGRSDVYIQKTDPDGNLIWVRKIGGTNDEWAHEIYLDAAGFMYISGEFSGTVDLDPGPGVSNFTAGGLHAFVSKLDTAGNLIWAKQFGGTVSYNYATSVASDPLGNVYASGYFWNGVSDFDPGTAVLNFSTGSYYEAFILKLDPDGNLAWAKQIGSNGHDWVNKITVDQDGNIFGTGEFQGIVDFDPGTGTTNLVSAGASDIFVMKLNTKGMFHWARRIGGNGWDEPSAITLDKFGNVYSTGRFVETVDFDPGAGIFNLTGNSIDAYISKLDGSGNFVWAKRFGGNLADFGQAIVTDESGNVYTSGAFVEKVDFDPGPDSMFLDAGSYNRNAFISKLDSGGNFIFAKALGGKSSNYSSFITLDHSGNIIAAGAFSNTGDFNPEPPIVNLTATGENPDLYVVKLESCASHSAITVSACEFYVAPSHKRTWTTSGIYRDTIPNTTGCDSVITIDLTIRYNGVSMMEVKTCDQLVSPSGKYTWTETGQYMDTIPNSTGCDSIILINLEVLMGTLTVAYNASTLTASTDSAVYQWLDCNNAYAPVANANGKHFKPAVNGNYAVRVTKNSCVDTSDCVNMTAVGLNEESFGTVKVFPNPTSGELSIGLSKLQSSLEVTITNLIGQEVLRQTFTQTDKIQLSIPGEAGIYFMELIGEYGQKVCMKVIKRE